MIDSNQLQEQTALFQKRSQFYKNPSSLLTYKIDVNKGITKRVDLSGIEVKNYHLNISGCASNKQRLEQAKNQQDESIAPYIPDTIKTRVPDVLPELLQEMNLSHFLPQNSTRYQLTNHTQRRDILNKMITLSDPKYGLQIEIPKRPSTSGAQKVRKLHKSSLVEPRTDHILILKNKSQSEVQQDKTNLLTSTSTNFKHSFHLQSGLNAYSDQNLNTTTKIGSSKSYHDLKTSVMSRNLLTNYSNTQKHDVRCFKIKGFLENARSMYNDWEERIAAKQRKEEIAAAAAVQAQKPGQKGQLVASPRGQQSKSTPPKVQSETEPEQYGDASRMIMTKLITSTSQSPDKTLFDHSLASTFYHERMSKAKLIQQQNSEEDEEHDFPFSGSKHLNKVGINQDQVKMSRRTRNDFDIVDRLKYAEIQPTKSKTNYEVYLQPHCNQKKQQTSEIFQHDTKAKSIVKRPGDHQIQNQKDLVRANPSLKMYFDKQLAAENKKLQAVYQGRLLAEKEVKQQVAKLQKTFQAKNEAAKLLTWQSPPRF